jgi:hypothetical protein
MAERVGEAMVIWAEFIRGVREGWPLYWSPLRALVGLINRLTGAAQRIGSLEDDVAYYKDEANQLGWMVDELKRFTIECSVCRELVPPGILYTTQYPRDEAGRLKHTCESCVRDTEEEANYPDNYPWDDSTMDGLNDACDWCGEPYGDAGHHAVCASEAERAQQR